MNVRANPAEPRAAAAPQTAASPIAPDCAGQKFLRATRLDQEEICRRERIRSAKQSDAAVAAVISVALAPYLWDFPSLRLINHGGADHLSLTCARRWGLNIPILSESV
jgi:hypothetical protein